MSIQFFYPPQPTRIWPDSSLIPSLSQNALWDAEIKYNGWRLLVFKLEPDKILLYNRHSTIIAIDWKQFLYAFKDVPVGTVFDGELLDRRTKDLKSTIVLWDCCFYDGKDLRLRQLRERRHHLDFLDITPVKFSNGIAGVFRVQQFSTDFAELYNSIDRRDDPIEEGLVLKNKISVYSYSARRGVDTTDWLKVKKIGDHARVSKAA